MIVYAVAFRPDGKCLATLGARGDDPGLGHRQRAASSRPSAWATRSRLVAGEICGARLEPGRPAARRRRRWTAWSGSGIPRPAGRRPGSRRKPDPWPGARTGPGSPWAGMIRAGGPPLGCPGRTAARASPSGNRAAVHVALLVARRPTAGRRLVDDDRRRAHGRADRLGRDERGEGLPGRVTPRSCGRSPSAPTAPGWRRAARKGSCGCSTRRMAGRAPPCSPGAVNVTGLAFSPDGRRLYRQPAGGWEGSRSSTRPAIPAAGASPGWLGQIAALTFDREGLRVLGIDWDRRLAGLRRPGRWRPSRSSRCSP